MQGSWFWMVIAGCVALYGLYILVCYTRKKNAQLQNTQTESRHGLPIIPRDERTFDTANTAAHQDQDALSDMAEAMQATPITTLNTPSDDAKPQAQSQLTAEPTAPTTGEAQIHIDQVDNGFDEPSQLLDDKLHEQEAFDEANNPLGEYEGTVTIVVTPQFGASISGRKVLEISHKYGLKHGAMNMFHRHEQEDGRGDRWFSMMAEDSNGPTAFDLNTLAEDHFTGLIFFLVLPHNQLLRGYDSMVSSATMLAGELNAILTDENRNLLDDEAFARLRGILANH